MTIYEKAIEHFGDNNQILKSVEELAELQKELIKHILDQQDEQKQINIIEEIADVEIMLEQLKIIFYCYDRVEIWKNIKLGRLETRINNAKG